METLLLDIPTRDFFDDDFVETVTKRLPELDKKSEKKTKSKGKSHQGDEVVIESPHPYRDNADDYTVIEVPRAVSYEITFDPRSATESGYDYVIFYKDDSHSEFFGESKYTGGRGGSSRNFPGTDGRGPLIINASRFVFYFHSDGGGNDWGYIIQVKTILSGPPPNPPVPPIEIKDLADVYLSTDFNETASADIYDIVREQISQEESDMAHDPVWQKRKHLLGHINIAIASLVKSSEPATAAADAVDESDFFWSSESVVMPDAPTNDIVLATSISTSLASIFGLPDAGRCVAMERLCSSLTKVFAASLPTLSPLKPK